MLLRQRIFLILLILVDLAWIGSSIGIMIQGSITAQIGSIWPFVINILFGVLFLLNLRFLFKSVSFDERILVVAALTILVIGLISTLINVDTIKDLFSIIFGNKEIPITAFTVLYAVNVFSYLGFTAVALIYIIQFVIIQTGFWVRVRANWSYKGRQLKQKFTPPLFVLHERSERIVFVQTSKVQVSPHTDHPGHFTLKISANVLNTKLAQCEYVFLLDRKTIKAVYKILAPNSMTILATKENFKLVVRPSKTFERYCNHVVDREFISEPFFSF